MTRPYDTPSPPPDESFALRATDILRRRATLAAVTFTAVMATAASLAMYLPDLFRATAVVVVERQLPDSFVRPAVGGELESRLHVIRQEVLGRANLTGLIDRFNLYPQLRARGDRDTALEQIRRDIVINLTGPEQVSGRTKTVAFTLTFTGEGRDVVADVTNAIASFYVAQNDQMRSEDAERTTLFLRARLDEAMRQLTRHERDVAAYTNRHAGGLPQQADMNLATLERLNVQLRLNGELILRTLALREALFEGLPSTATALPTDPRAALAVQLDRLKRELAQLEGFPDKNPDVTRLKDEIARLEREGPLAPEVPSPDGTGPVARAGARTLESLDAELDRLRREEAALGQTLVTVQQRLEDVPYRQNELALILREQQAAKDLYDSLLKRYEEAQLAESMETANQGERFRILESAIAPMGPSAPNRFRLLLMGALLAALLAGLAVLLREEFDTSFHTADDVRQFTRVPVLVSVPCIARPMHTRILRSAGATACILAGLTLIAALSAYVASANAQLVRFLVRGG